MEGLVQNSAGSDEITGKPCFIEDFIWIDKRAVSFSNPVTKGKKFVLCTVVFLENGFELRIQNPLFALGNIVTVP